jgi:hypothetical protein
MVAVLIIICTLSGVVLGLRFKVFVLAPAMLLATAVTIASGIMRGHAPSFVALATLGTLVSLQIGYLVGSVLQGCLPMRTTSHYRLSGLWHH